MRFPGRDRLPAEPSSSIHRYVALSFLSLHRQTLSRTLCIGLGLAGLTAAGIGLTDRADARRTVRNALSDGRHFDDSLNTEARAARAQYVAFPSAIALGYLARLQLGLGSPFRLVDLARTDPRLPIVWRARVAYALLARLADDRAAMRALPHALDVALVTDSGVGSALLRVVDSVMALEGDSPLTLDAIRIAAAQESASGALRPGAVPLLDAAALLAFDRVRARRDVERAITAASRADGDLLQLVATWRAERRFAVERPLLADVAPAARRIAARLPAMVAAMDHATRRRDVSLSAPESAALSVRAASSLSMLISVRTRPVQPQVHLSVLDAIMVAADRRAASASSIVHMLNMATNEETLAMVVATTAGDSVLSPMAATATLLATQGMRTLAQEAPFHPGTLVLDPEQVEERLGLASLTFGRDVPAAWQPYYAREFATAVDAVHDVFPRASFIGLNVRIGDHVLAGALAVHDPRTRTLTLPLATGFGAVGHELMHDLDWQSARDYGRREGTYATDNAVRASRTQPIAAPLARLAEFVPIGATANAYVTEARRPAELLARGADWFLAAALARRGRINGALSAVQDGWVRGYASAAGPEAFGDHGAALAAVFDAMPTLAVRASVTPRSDAEREPDLGTIARAAWFTPMPTVESLGDAAAGRTLIPLATAGACSPVARLRLAPIHVTAREVAAGFVEPRITRAMRRWARQAETTGIAGTDAAVVRLALLGAPMNPTIADSARRAWSAAAWRNLPCLAD